MTGVNVNDQQSAIKRMQDNLLWYVRLRYAVSFLLLGAGIGATLLLVGWDAVIVRTLALGAVALTANTLIWWASTRKNSSLIYYKTLAVVQFMMDVLVVSYLIYAQGNVQQYATILFAIPIVASGFLFDRTVTIINAALVSAVFSTLIIWNEFNFRPIELAASFSPAPAAYDFLVPIVFYSTAFMILALMAERVSEFKRKAEIGLAQDEIISLATHQLRVPATAVKGFLALLHQAVAAKLDAKQRKHLELAIDENNHQLRLVDNLLKTAVLDADKIELFFEPASLLSVIRRVVAEQRYFASYKEVDVQLTGRDIKIDMNQESLQIVFSNLLHNALKYSPYKSVVRIRLNADQDLVRVCVQDQGPGLTREDKKRLFKRFSRSNRDEQVGGAGLGLYIANMLVKKHNGYIEVLSKPKKGSEFCVTLHRQNGGTHEVLAS